MRSASTVERKGSSSGLLRRTSTSSPSDWTASSVSPGMRGGREVRAHPPRHAAGVQPGGRGRARLVVRRQVDRLRPRQRGGVGGREQLPTLQEGGRGVHQHDEGEQAHGRQPHAEEEDAAAVVGQPPVRPPVTLLRPRHDATSLR